MHRTQFSTRFTRVQWCIDAHVYARLLLAMFLSALSVGVQAQHQPLVAVAASMASATESIVRQFHTRTGVKTRLSFGASGNLARQVLRGAPFELFISADQSYPQGIVDAGLSDGPSTSYAIGQLALMVTSRSGIDLAKAREKAGTLSKDTLSSDLRAMTIRSALRDPRIERISMANPIHAPYGRAARQSLQFLGLWASLQAKVVMGGSVAQSARFATTGAVQAALLPLGIILHSPLAKEQHIIIPPTWHAPLRQQMVLIRSASVEARRLFEFMHGDEARAILVEHGFIVAGKALGVR